MNKLPLICATALLVPLSSSNALAQPDSAAIPVSLRQAVNAAVDKRLEIQIAEARLAGTRAKAKQALARFYPSLDAGVLTESIRSYDTFSGVTASATVMGQPATVTVQRTAPRYSVTPSLRLGYDVYSGGRDRALLQSATASERSAELEVLLMSREVVKDVTIKYLLLKKAYLRYKNAQLWTEHTQRREPAFGVRFNAGKASELEVRTEALAHQERKLNLRRFEVELQAKLAEYFMAVGMNPKDVALDPNTLPDLTANLDDELEFITKWQDSQLEAEKARADMHAARHTIAAEKAAFAPQANVYVQYGGVGRAAESAEDAYRNLHRKEFSIGFTVSVNLFSGFSSSAKVSEAQAEYRRLSLQLDQLEQGLALAKRTLQATYDSDLAQEKFLQERREHARLRLLVVQAKADTGKEGADSVERAKMELADIDQALAEAKIDQTVSGLRMRFASAKDVGPAPVMSQ